MHEQLLEAAKRAIEDLFSDGKVSIETTLQDMKELRDLIDENLDMLESDLELSIT